MGYDAPADDPFASDEVYGDNIPSADDTGFFTLPEEGPDDLSVLLQQDNGKKRHRGLKVFLVILILLVLLVGAAGVLFWQGFGYPSQETTIEELFTKTAAGEDASDCWIATSSEEDQAKIAKIMNSVAPTTNYTIDYLEKGMMESEAIVTATLDQGGEVRYDITMTRDFSSLTSWIGWKINGIDLAFPSVSDLSTASTSAGAETPMDEQVDAAQAPAAEQPAVEQPVEEQPIDELPVEEQPAVEQPIDEQPAA